MANQGDLIRRLEYNNLYSSMIDILGSGSAGRGYGQTPNSSPSTVAAGARITRAHWANLRLDLLRIAGHQGIIEDASWTPGTLNSIPVLPPITTTTRISANVVVRFTQAATVLGNVSNIYRLAVGQFSDEAFSPNITSTRTTAWNGTIRHYFQINYGSSDAARWFFNAGGRIFINPSFNPSATNPINNDWLTLVGNNTSLNPGVGTSSFGHTNTTRTTLTTAETEASSIGFYDLTNSATQIFTRSGGTANSFYAVNDYTVRVYCNVANNSSGGASIIYFECEFNDDKGFRNPLFPSGDESVTGTVINTVTMRRPSGSNVNVNAPSASNSIVL